MINKFYFLTSYYNEQMDKFGVKQRNDIGDRLQILRRGED